MEIVPKKYCQRAGSKLPVERRYKKIKKEKKQKAEKLNMFISQRLLFEEEEKR